MDDTLRAIQLCELEILKEFVRVCEKNGLRYFLVGGTLLGAVRHKGFIPWDDDIDVAMPQEDYEKAKVLLQHSPKLGVLTFDRRQSRYPFLYMKLFDAAAPALRADGTHGAEGVYVDVFPLAPARGGKIARGSFNILNVVNYVLQTRSGWEPYVPYKMAVARLGYRGISLLPSKVLYKLRDRLLANICDPKSQDILCSVGGVYRSDKEFYPAAWFAHSVEMEFEGQMMAAPVGWQAFLRRNYGDYMTLPPESERKQHTRPAGT